MKLFCLSAALIFCTSCSSLSQSLQLGGVTGALVGAAAIAAGSASSTERVKAKSVALGVEIGSLLGLGMSYMIHRVVENDRRLGDQEQTEMHFGDLPPNPFSIPKSRFNQGGH